MPAPLLHTPYIPTPYPEMVEIKGGSYLSKIITNEQGKAVEEHPIGDFRMSKYLITNAQFAIFLNDYRENLTEGYQLRGDTIFSFNKYGILLDNGICTCSNGFENYPAIVGRASWLGILAYSAWLSKKLGRNFRPPTEKEWEYAANGGIFQNGLPFSGSNKLKEVGWFRKNNGGGVRGRRPVGLKMPNQLGLYDMSGNVWELCTKDWAGNCEVELSIGSSRFNGSIIPKGGTRYKQNQNCKITDSYWDDPRDLSPGFRIIEVLG